MAVPFRCVIALPEREEIKSAMTQCDPNANQSPQPTFGGLVQDTLRIDLYTPPIEVCRSGNGPKSLRFCRDLGPRVFQCDDAIEYWGVRFGVFGVDTIVPVSLELNPSADLQIR